MGAGFTSCFAPFSWISCEVLKTCAVTSAAPAGVSGAVERLELYSPMVLLMLLPVTVRPNDPRLVPVTGPVPGHVGHKNPARLPGGRQQQIRGQGAVEVRNQAQVQRERKLQHAAK